MRTDLFWIPGPWPGRLAIAPRPRGGDWLEDEIRAWRSEGVDAVASLLVPEEIADLDLSEEPRLARANDIEFLSFPIRDRSVPAPDDAALEFATNIADRLADGKKVVIHCRQGIGRAALVAISVLLVSSGGAFEEVIEQVAAARGVGVPETPEQRRWLEKFAAGLKLVSP
ncbi:MAG TPA: dual specificity protein phosphatase family protein [Planctomycetia bacterium]|nr:dual specificity protein phosphatase family protein [Planctomycetia bacterium]